MLFFSYAAVITFLVLYSDVVERNLLNATFMHPVSKAEFKATKWMVLRYLMGHSGSVIFLCLLSFVMALAISGFFIYHLTLIYRGMTTNESMKWGSLAKFHQTLVKAHKKFLKCTEAEIEDYRAKGELLPLDKIFNISSTGGFPEKSSETESKSTECTKLEDMTEVEQARDEIAKCGEKEKMIEVNDDCTDEIAGCIPKSSRDERHHFKRVLKSLPRDAEGMQIIPEVLEMNPGELPHNAYNRGFFKNLDDIMYPASVKRIREMVTSHSDRGRKNGMGNNLEVYPESEKKCDDSNQRGVRKRGTRSKSNSRNKKD